MRTYLAIGIALVWAFTYVGSVVSGDYTGFEISTPVMLIAATFLLGSELRHQSKDDDS